MWPRDRAGSKIPGLDRFLLWKTPNIDKALWTNCRTHPSTSSPRIPASDPFSAAKMSTTVTQAPAITAENVLRLFPEVNTTLIGGTHNSATNDDALEGYDEEQIRLMDEVCIVLDENDVPIGSASKKVCKWHPRTRNRPSRSSTC